MSWDKLSMTDRASYIKLGVANGITDLNTIRSMYNKYAEGGPIKSYKDFKSKLSNYWTEDIDTHDYDYQKYYNDNPEEAYKQLNSILSGGHGHFPDGGKSGTYKKPSHPTYPDLGDKSWNNDETIFHLSDRQASGDTDRILDYLGSDLNYNKGATKVTYKGGNLLPTVYVTPKGNYTELVPNKLHTGWVYEDSPFRAVYNKYAQGGGLNDDANSDSFLGMTTSEWKDLGTSMIPIYGTYKEVKNAILQKPH